MSRRNSYDDYKTQNMDAIRLAIQKRIDQGIRRFAVLPMGFWGRETKRLLENEFHRAPQACFDNGSCCDPDVYPVSMAETMDLPDTVFLLAIEEEYLRGQLYQQLSPFVPDNRIELIPLLNAEQKKIFGDTEKIHLDFLCAGFHKCATTSLQAALQLNQNVFLPQVKETFFAMFVTEGSYEKFRQSYLDAASKGSWTFVGGIEPTYPPYAASVHQYFGDGLKILFLVRNPVKALRSAFKMSMRGVGDISLVQKYEKICPGLIQEYIEANYKRFVYIDFIRMYERFYPQSQIKIVLTEELLQNPLEQMDEIQAFIGLPEKARITYHDFPHENKGDTVFKSLGGAYVNNALNHLRMSVQDVSLYLQIEEIRKKVFDITTESFDLNEYEGIWKETYCRYAKSVSDLEKRIGRTLEGIWY